jgi:integrase
MDSAHPPFRSPLADVIATFVAQKRALGYKYQSEELLLRGIDRFLAEQGIAEVALPRDLVDRLTARRPHQRPRTHATRVSMVRQLACFMLDRGLPAYAPPVGMTQKVQLDFTPYIFGREAIRGLWQAADRLPAVPVSPLHHLVMPEVFRLLYSCGLRVSEVVRLSVDDVDLESGVLRIRQGKFRKDRLVPVAPTMTERLRRFQEAVGRRPAESPFFTKARGAPHDGKSIYITFRRLLRDAGIPHGGRGRGPRLHDLRHTFAVHRLEEWVRAGVDLDAGLPVLAAYMGHQSLTGTQRYLRITPEVFPDIVASLDKVVGYAIPKEARP